MSEQERAQAPGNEPADGIVCYAGVDWWYHNRGHSECQIMRRLAARTTVLWVNSIGMRVPRPGKTELPFRRYARKLKSSLTGLRRDPSGLWVYSPLFFPRYSSRALELNGRLLHLQTSALLKHLRVRNPAVWATLPSVAPAVARRRWVRTVFNRSDAFAAFPEVDSRVIGAMESRMLDASDHVLYVNRGLFDEERSRVRNAHLIGHGVDFDHFASAGRSRASATPPPKIADLPRPIVGFYGALDDYTVDLELMIETARSIRPGTLLVIGPKAMEIDKLLREPNVCYLGPVPYEEIPAYAAQFDVGIMPWLQNEWIERCNPIKLKEYLALGFPIVSTRFPELEPFEHLVYAADSTEHFLARLAEALKEEDPERVESRRRFVEADGWEPIADRAAELLHLLPADAPHPTAGDEPAADRGR